MLTNESKSSSIREKFESREYELAFVPRIILLENDQVFINVNGAYPDEIESLEKSGFDNTFMKETTKLKVTDLGDTQFYIGMIHERHFESREKLDEMYLRENGETMFEEMRNIPLISLRNVLESYPIQLSVNLDYYLKDVAEFENDLCEKSTLIKLEQELFYKQMCTLFGEIGNENDAIKCQDDETIYEKTFNLKDFRLLYIDGNSQSATAKRGNYYLLFSYATS
jgi:hypothetical protein